MSLREGLFVALLLGFSVFLAFVGVEALRTGESQAKATRYKRTQQPGWYWTVVVGQLVFSAYFLAGAAFVAWRALS